ncbi:MAG: glycosyltransferase [Candidatus Limnocylindrales bacterium]
MSSSFSTKNSAQITPARVATRDCIGARNAVIVPVGPGNIENSLDTIDSVLHYIDPGDEVVVVDDFTHDGTYEKLAELKHDQLTLIRNDRSNGYRGLHVTVTNALRHLAARGPFAIILRLDWDALVTGPHVFDEVARFLDANRHVGICGRHLMNYDGSSKSYRVHTEDALNRIGYPPPDDRDTGGIGWIARRAQLSGWGLGENVFGGAFFLRFECVEAMLADGFLDRIDDPRFWLIEDVFFTMCALATGFDRAHFAAPIAPYAFAYRDLPAPPAEIIERGIKVVHSVDHGRWASAEANGGLTAREIFKRHRQGEVGHV